MTATAPRSKASRSVKIVSHGHAASAPSESITRRRAIPRALDRISFPVFHQALPKRHRPRSLVSNTPRYHRNEAPPAGSFSDQKLVSDLSAYRASPREQSRVRSRFDLAATMDVKALNVGARAGHLTLLVPKRFARVVVRDLERHPPPPTGPQHDATASRQPAALDCVHAFFVGRARPSWVPRSVRERAVHAVRIKRSNLGARECP